MEALEFLKAAKRRYEDSPNEYSELIYLDDFDFEIYVKNVEKWAKEHPAKTRQSEFLKMFPNVEIREDGFVDLCPCNLDKVIYEKCSGNSTDCDECFKVFWSKEVE